MQFIKNPPRHSVDYVEQRSLYKKKKIGSSFLSIPEIKYKLPPFVLCLCVSGVLFTVQ